MAASSPSSVPPDSCIMANRCTRGLAVLKNKLQFDLATIFASTAALAIALAFVAGTQQTASWTWRFSSLPPNDTALEKWLVENGHAGVVTTDRRLRFVAFEKKSRAVPGIALTMPQVPWEDLHYTSPILIERSTGWTVFGTPLSIWHAALVALATLSAVYKQCASRPRADDGVES